jgi:uncharacterized protein (TIGR02271 family)
MASTLIGYFDDFDQARQTEKDLLDSGFAENEVDLVTEAPELRAQTRTEPSGFWENMKALFGLGRAEEETEYREAARHGTIVAVRAPDDRVDLAASIIERHAPVDLDRKREEWGTGGMQEMQAEEMEEEETIPVMEEQLQVGKQMVRRGAVRIHQFVVQRRAEAEIPLREEEIDIERRSVDRPADPGEEPFREREISIEAMGEEPVVSKEARVVEEVSVGKKAKERTEKVSEDVRKTEVEVEDTKERKR